MHRDSKIFRQYKCKEGYNKYISFSWSTKRKEGNSFIVFMADELAAKYNLSRLCAKKIYSCMISGANYTMVDNVIEYVVNMLARIGKNQDEINDIVNTFLRYGIRSSVKELNNLLRVCVSEGNEVEEVLTDDSITAGMYDENTLYSLIKITKKGRNKVNLGTLAKVNSKLNDETKEKIRNMYPLTSKARFVEHVKFMQYLDRRVKSSKENVLCK